MEDNNNQSLVERVQRLEAIIERLTVQVENFISSTSPRSTAPGSAFQPPPPPTVLQKQPPAQKIEQAPPPTPRAAMAEPAAHEPSFTIPDHMKKSEYWLNKIGIALLLFGAVFLFKYSVEQGWLTPTIRVLFGLALGAALTVIGLRLYTKRKHFSQVLLGGSIATFYITGFAAYQLFHLVPHPAAFIFYVAVTLYSFFLSLKQNEFIFSLIAIIGGLGTPFILYTGEGSIPGLMLYLCILLTGASGIYFFKGWWSFFWTSCIGGWTVISIAMFGDKSLTYAPLLDKISIEVALFLALPLFWLVPLAREIAIVKNPKLLGTSLPKPTEKSPGSYQPNLPEINVNLLTIVTPFLSLFLSTAIWQWQDAVWGWVSLALAIAGAGIGWALNAKTSLKNFAYTHLVVGLILLAVAIYFFFEGDVLLVAITLQAAAIHFVKIRIDNKSLAPLAHTLYGVIGFWVLGRITDSRQGSTLLNEQALSDLILPVSAFVLFKFFKDIQEKRIYLIGGFAALAGILFRELDGNILFFVIAVETLALLYISSRMNDRGLLTAAHLFGAAVAGWLMYRLFDPSTGPAVFNEKSFIDFIVLASIAGATFLLKDRDVKQIYFFVAHIALLFWFLRELSPLTNGQGIVSVAWGLYIVALFVFGLRKNLTVVTKTAMATLLVLVGKLFLIDLANLETIWRVLLFLGFGAVLLLLSYYFQALWKTKKG